MNTFIEKDTLICSIKSSIRECTNAWEIAGIIRLVAKIFDIPQQAVEIMLKSEIDEWLETHIVDNSIMKLRIRNDREVVLSTIKVIYNPVNNTISIDNESLDGFIIDDVDGDDECTTVYDLILTRQRDIVEELSNQTLLNEIQNRMAQ